MRKAKNGFTLIEILTVVAIMAVMAGLAVPVYTGQIELARGNEAITNLRIIYAAEKIYALNHNGSYWAPTASPPSAATVNTALNIDISTNFYPISIMTTSATQLSATYSITMDRLGAGTKTYTLTNASPVIVEGGAF